MKPTDYFVDAMKVRKGMISVEEFANGRHLLDVMCELYKADALYNQFSALRKEGRIRIDEEGVCALV